MRKTHLWPFKPKFAALIMIGFTTCGALPSIAADLGDGDRVNVVCTEPFPLSEGESLELSMFLLAQESTEAGRATAEIIGPRGVVSSEDFAVVPGAVTTINLGSGLNGSFVGCVKSKGSLGKLLDKLGDNASGAQGLGKLSAILSKKKVGGLIDKFKLGWGCCCSR